MAYEKAKSNGALLAQVAALAKDFAKAGFPDTLARTYAIAQAMHESDWMTSNVFNKDNNASGITWINKPYQDATRGTAKPKSEGGGYYAHFDNFDKYAKDFLRILSLNTGKQGRPIDAETAQQYLDRLKANHYFTDNNYYLKFNAALKKVSDVLRWSKDQDQTFLKQYNAGERTFTTDSEKGLVSNKEFDMNRRLKLLELWAKDHPYLAVGAAVCSLVALTQLVKAFKK